MLYFLQVFAEDFGDDDEFDDLISSGSVGLGPCPPLMSQSMTAAVPSSIEALLPAPAACRSSLYDQRASSSLIGKYPVFGLSVYTLLSAIQIQQS